MVELFSCDYVPPKVPDFVDPHITVEQEGNKETYIVEVNLNHAYIQRITLLGRTVKQELESFGFINLVSFYKGEKPSFN